MASAKFNDTGFSGAQASGALAAYRRVKRDANGQVGYAAAADKAFGVTQDVAQAANDVVSIKLANAPGTVQIVAVDAIAINAAVYGAASGKCSASSAGSAVLIGYAMNASTADGDVIEVYKVDASA